MMKLFLRHFFLLTAASLIVTTLTLCQNTWQTRSIPSIKTSINAMAAGSGSVYAATNGSGLYKTTDGGATWTKISTITMPNNYYSIALDAHGNLYAGSFKGQVFISPDGGTTWNSSIVGLASANVSSFSFAAPSAIYAGSEGEGFFVSQDAGVTWTSIGTGISYPLVTSSLVDSRGRLLAGTYGDGVYTSANKGQTWSWVGLVDYPVYTHPNNTTIDTGIGVAGNFLRVNALVAGTGTRVFMATDQGIFYDSLRADSIFNDSTGRFVRIDTGRTDWFIDTLGTHAGRLFVETMISTSDGHIFAGTYGGGVYRSTNNGNSWSRRDSIPSTANVHSLAIDDSGYVYAGTTTGVIYRSTTRETISAPAPAPLTALVPLRIPTLEQNYPNPFNPTTTIPFTLYKSGYTRLVIYDMLGREIARVVDGNLTAGRHAFEWNASAVPSGTYFYRLQSAAATQTGKLILLK